MSSTQLRSLEIAAETSFCGLSAVQTTPTETGTYSVVDFLDLTQLLVEGEPLVDDPSGLRGGVYANPDRPVVIDDDRPVRGSFSFDFYLKAWASTDKGILDLLKTRFDIAASASVSSTVSAATSGSQTVTASTSVNTSAGGVCMILHDSLTLYGYVCGYTSGTSFNLTPNIVDRGAAVGDGINGCMTLCIPTQGLPATTSSCAIRIKGQGWTQTCLGCTLTSLSMTNGGDSRGVKCTATVDCAYVITDTIYGTPAVLAADSTIGILHQLSSPLALGDTFDLTTGSFSSGNQANSLSYLPSVCVDEWTLTIDFTTAYSSCGSYVVGRSRAETVQAEISLDMELAGLAAHSEVEQQWLDQAACTVLLGFTGSESGSIIGGAIAIPAAVVKDFSSAPDLGSDFARSHVVFAPGPCPVASQPCFVLALRN